MSTVYNPESDTIAEIERVEITARDLRRRLKAAKNEEDRRVLKKLIAQAEDQVESLRMWLPDLP